MSVKLTTRQVGDVRTRDAELLAAHPELRAHYEAWAGAQHAGTSAQPSGQN